MRTAEAVLDVIRNRSIKGLHLDEDVYRQLYNPLLYLQAYSRIYKNDGALTQGGTEETADGMSRVKIETIIEQMHAERFRWTPVRRVEIPKKNGKMRPGVLRTTLLCSQSWISTRTGVSHGACRNLPYLERRPLVHRGRYSWLL